MDRDWARVERELRRDIEFIKQAIHAKEIARGLAVSEPLPLYRPVSPVDANWANLADDDRRIVTQVQKAPAKKLTTKGKDSGEGECLQRMAEIQRLLTEMGHELPAAPVIVTRQASTGKERDYNAAKANWDKAKIQNIADQYPEHLRSLIKESRTKG